jgi:hypothetical protein
VATENTTSQADAQARLLALKHEKAGYAQRGMTDRVKQVDDEIKRWGEVAKNAADNPDAASEVRVDPEVAEAENRLRGLEDEKRGLAGRSGVEKRIAAIDEEIKRYTGVLRKASGAAEPEGAKPTAGQQQRGGNRGGS